MSGGLSPSLMILGLSKKAGKTVCGVPLVCASIEGGKIPSLVVMSTTASDNTKKKVRDKCTYYKVELYESVATTEQLALSIGSRGECAAVGIFDEGLARLFLTKAANDIERKED